jgi:CubicO group peptidase (beta-lactamase class C family)
MSAVSRSLFILSLLLAAHGEALAQCPDPYRASPGGYVAPSIKSLELDRRIETLLEEFEVTPGLAVGVIKDGRKAYARGFGHRELETCAPATEKTGFYLLSVTKSFTGMLAALLHEEGVIELDQSLAHYFSGIAMGDSINPAQTSVRDLLNHRAGFRNGAINFRTFVPGNVDNAELMRLLENHSQPAPITFRYSNTAYIVAAAVMEKVTGTTWRELLEQKLFQPLGMSTTTPYIERAKGGEFAWPYTLDRDGSFVRAPVKVEAQMHAAGGVVSSVEDLLRWVEMNLSRGRLDGEQVLPERAVRQALSPQIQYDWTYYKFRRFAYGFGVHNSDYEGDLLIHHFGGPIHLSFMPEHNLGVVVLTNGTQPSLGFSHMLAAYIYDLLLEKPDVDAKYEREAQDVKDETLERLERFRTEEDELLAQGSPEPLARPFASYEGRYHSDRLGTMVVETEGDQLVLTYGVVVTELIPHQPDAFLTYLIPGELPVVFRFELDDEGNPIVLDWDGRRFDLQTD